MVEFNRLEDTAFPNLDTVDPYRYKVNFAFSKFKNSQMRIRVLNVSWDLGSVHVGNRIVTGIGNVVHFGSKAARNAWFDAKKYAKTSDEWMTGGYDGFEWVTDYRRYHSEDKMTLPLPFDVLAKFNYVTIDYYDAPVDYEQDGIVQWYYFIRNFEMKAANSTVAEIYGDLWTTYVYDMHITQMMLEQGHALVGATDVDEYLADPIGNNRYLLAEDLSFGELQKVASAESVSLNSSDMWAVIVTTSSPGGQWTLAGKENVPSPVLFDTYGVPSHYAIGIDPENLDGLLTWLENNIPQFKQTIKGIFFIAKDLVRATESYTFGNYECVLIRPSRTQMPFITLNKDMFGYDAKYSDLAKLYTYPYAAIKIADNEGNSTLVKVEETTGTIDLDVASNVAFPYIAIDAHLKGVGGKNAGSITFRDVSLHTFEFSGRWYEHVKKWDVPIFAITQNAAKDYEFREYYHRAQRRLAADTAEDIAKRLADTTYDNALASNATANANTLASNATANANAKASNATVNANAKASNATAYDNAVSTNGQAMANALLENQTSYDNSTASNATTNANALASNATANANALASNATANANAKASNATANTNAKDSNFATAQNAYENAATTAQNAYESIATSTDNTYASNAATAQNAYDSAGVSYDNAIASNATTAQNSYDNATANYTNATASNATANDNAKATNLTARDNAHRDADTMRSNSVAQRNANSTMTAINNGAVANNFSLSDGENYEKAGHSNDFIDFMTNDQIDYTRQSAAIGAVSNVIGSAVQGASGGAMAGPAGAAVGAIGGAVAGLAGAGLSAIQTEIAINLTTSQASNNKSLNNANYETTRKYNTIRNSDDTVGRAGVIRGVNLDSRDAQNTLIQTQTDNSAATVKQNAAGVKIMADANADRSKTTADANALRTKTATDGNTLRTKTTADSNALDTKNMTDANIERTKDTADANAEATKNTTDGNTTRTKETTDKNIKRTKDTSDANADRSKTTGDANADRSKTTDDANANRTKATADANANRTKVTADANALRTYETNETVATDTNATANAVALSKKTTDDANADRTKATGDANADRTKTTDDANANRTKATADANALRTKDTSYQNAEDARELVYADVQADTDSAALGAPIQYGEFAHGETAITRPMALFANVVTQSDDAIAQAGDNFLRYGYRHTGAWDFDGEFNVMPKFTFWKCSDLWIEGLNMPDEHVDYIRFLLIGGVTVWRDPDYIGHTTIYENR